MSNAERILNCLDAKLQQRTELTLYGRAALQLGFDQPPPEFAQSMDVDVVLWLGQTEELMAQGNLWDAVAETNRELADDRLYISHFFEEDQIVLKPNWKDRRVMIDGEWRQLKLMRLADEDLFLSKCMRDDPLDLADARFIWARAGWTMDQVKEIMAAARVPDIPELKDQFEHCVSLLLGAGK